MNAYAAVHVPPPEADILRAQLDELLQENADLRDELRIERARRQTMVDLAAVHVRSLIAFVEHTQRELKQDEAEAKAQR